MSPERDPPKMKCLLLLLTFRFVFSDKLDHTYLPPPRATFAGGNPYELQAPLEYTKPNYPETTPNGHASGILQEKWFKDTPASEVLDTEFLKSKAVIDYSTTKYPDEFDQANSFSTSGYDSFVETTRPEISSYGSFSQKPPSSGYLPSRQSTTQQPYFTSSFNTDANDETAFDAKVPGYYYVPTLQFNGYNLANQELRKVVSNDVPNSEFIQYPNEINDRFISDNEQTFTPKIATTDDIAQNYQPSAFGYYGGNPMIMTSQNYLQVLGNTEVISKFGEKEDNLLTNSVNQNKQNTNNRPSAQPFQTPLVRTKMQNVKKSGDFKTFTTSPPRYTEQSNLPRKTTSSFTEDNIQHQKSNPPVRPRYKAERPQADSDRKAIILNYENVITPEAFSYSFDTSNGIHAEQSGTSIEGVKTKGSYSFTGDDGKVYSVTYIADENGFQPKGDHLPTLPPVPEAIKKLIKVAEKNKAAGIIDDGSYDEKKYGHMNYQGAMDRYPFKNNEAINIKRRIGNKVSRPTNIRKRPNTNTKVNDKGINQPVSNENFPKVNESQLATTRQQYLIGKEKESSNELLTNANENYTKKPNIKSQQTKKRRPASQIKDNQQNLFMENSENKLHVDVNKAPNKNVLYVGMGTELNTFNQTEERVEYKFEKPSGSINSENQFKNENNKPINEIIAETQMTINYKPESNNSGISSSNIEDNSNEMIKYKYDDIDGVNFTNDGYYYVPPSIKFSPFNDQRAYKTNTYTTNTESARPYVDTIASKRIAVGSSLNPKTIDERLFSNQSLSSESNGESTRKPYISGPNDRSRKYNNNGMQTKYPLEKGRDELEYTKDIDSSSYVYTTTPIPSQNTQYTSPDGYPNQYYQTTSYPAAFEPTLPNSINREIINSETPGVRVSQDFVTTTYRPTVFNDGVLEVNQNVKIYGLGRPGATVASRLPVKFSTYNNGFYTTNIPKEELRFTGAYPDRVFERPVQDMNQDLTYENEFHTTASPGFNSGFGIKAKEKIDGRSDFENAQFTPGQEQTTSTVFTQNLSPTEGFIGEDFSGPKQPQWFDPATGYYY